MMSATHVVRDPSAIFSPGLLFYPDRIRHNIQTMLALAGGPQRLRPHVKTNKCPQVVRLQLDAGITRFKCATIAEAEMLGQCQAPDVLLAYPMVGPNCGRLAQLVKKYPHTKYSVLVDHPHSARQLSQAIAAAGQKVGVMLDLDVGMHRTGIPAGPDAQQLYRLVADLPGLTPAGLSVYDGQNHQESLQDRQKAVDQLLAPVVAMRADLEKAGLPVAAIVAGGTPTFAVFAHIDLPGLECSPGTCVLHDHGYGSRFAELREFVPAALLLTRVISRPAPTRLTLDLGYKAVASDPPAGKRLILLDAPPHEMVLQNEEHLAIDMAAADRYAPGDVFYAVPTHICPTVAMHQFAYVIEGGAVVDRWAIVGRDRMLTV